ncbi:putative membrane protein [Hydrogenivirga caldilitoris]|uniref:Putative membrane protein n=1 Tax=Hydrogenivirga caldilitoris TaxID=246264 RepID=A0A497XTU3_9AQUI|nr:DUF996 domain-containing protein [Hydrogenivirga caldilitoris]RLJ70343.1 putative membrane protein [Hydrogenivirga caldilitoris]
MSKQTKQLGGWGLVGALVASILSAAIPFIGILALVGWILAVIAYIKASEELGEPEIKANVIKAIVAGVVALVVFILGGGTMAAGMLSQMREGGGMHMGGTGLLIMVVAWVIGLVAAWFWYKANSYMTEKTQVGLFKTGGLLMFVGAVLAIILIGGLISLIGEILLIVAWFSVQEKVEEPQTV